MSPPAEVVFLIDCDNTLLDNDRVREDLGAYLAANFGAESRDRYWALLEQMRAELGYTDYLGALQRFRLERLCDPRVLRMSSFLVDYPFADRVYPGALEVLHHLRNWGRTVILSDGDVVFQPRKVERSGLWAAVEGRVMIVIHKEQALDDVAAQYPAKHYVMIDDKVRLLSAIKQSWGVRVTTVFARQGHYALDRELVARYPAADLTVDAIGDLLQYDLARLLGGRGA